MIGSARMKSVDQVALVVLCLLLTAAVAMRALAYQRVSPAVEAAGEAEAIDLGAGVFLPRSAAVRRELLLGACRTPVTIDFVEPSPHGRDASLTVPPDPGDRVFYAYRGWPFDGRLAAAEVGALHFAWRAGAVLRMDGARGRYALAVKMTVPDGCAAGPEDALAALRQDVLAWR